MALTLNIGGSPAIALVQAGQIVKTSVSSGAQSIAASLPLPSTAGTALIAVVGGYFTAGTSPTVTSFPAGWARLATVAESTDSILEVWAYLNNPGAISSLSILTTSTSLPAWRVNVSEWSNVAGASALEASGTATAVAGTTLALTTSTNVLTAGDVAIAAWHQVATGVATYTTPAGFTKLIDDGTGNTTAHLDAEYKLNPTTGAALSATMTSTLTTTSATGAIVVLKKSPPAVDQTAYLKAYSMSLKLNTFDFALIDPVTVPSLGDAVALTVPTWNGRVVSLTLADIVDRATGHKLVTIAATNQATATTGSAPALTDGALSGGYIQLETGAGNYQLEDGSGSLLLEGSSFPYRGLSVSTTQNVDGSLTTYGSLTTFENGFAPGQSFLLTSSNLGYSAQSFTITNVTTTWIGLGVPALLIEFGDAYQTLQRAGGGVLTNQGSTAVTQQGVAVPGGVLGYAAVTAAQTGITTIADLTGLTVTMTVTAGRRIKISGQTQVSSTTATDVVELYIYEAASQLQAAIVQLNALQDATLPISLMVQPSAGVHTYYLRMQRAAGAGTVTMDAAPSFPSYILVEDIGT